MASVPAVFPFRNPSRWPSDCMDKPVDTLATANPFEAEKRVRFEEKTHTYYVDGKKTLVSVTGLIKAPFPKFDADAVIKRMRRKRSAEEKYPGLSDEQIKEKWKKDNGALADQGTKMHAAIEVFLNTGYTSKDTTLEKEMGLWMRFYEKEITDAGLEVIRTEIPVFAKPETGASVAGCVDCLLWDPKAQEHVLMDWKRSKEIKMPVGGRFAEYGIGPLFERHENVNFVHYSLQLHVYRVLLQDTYGVRINPKRMFIVVLHPNQVGYMKLRAQDMEKEAGYLIRNFGMYFGE